MFVADDPSKFELSWLSEFSLFVSFDSMAMIDLFSSTASFVYNDLFVESESSTCDVPLLMRAVAVCNGDVDLVLCLLLLLLLMLLLLA